MDFEDIFSFFVFILIILFIAIIVFSSIFISSIGAINSGQHTGYITAVEEKGIIWKTTSTYVKTDVSSSQEDMYCVTDTNVINSLKTKSEKRELVTIEFSRPFIVWKWECGKQEAIVRLIK